uniref:Si:dkey-13e3.1 n=1 Tax=Cyprinus carpio TaxID=7962 RepID=A0A8C1W1K7_CYPCA
WPKREDFWKLGLRREMESDVSSNGKYIYTADMYVVTTWKDSVDPLAYLPDDADMKDALVFPLWTKAAGPEHYLSIAHRLDPGQWTEVTGLDIGVTHNYNTTVHSFTSYALYTVLNTPFNFTSVIYCWSLNSNKTN